MLRLEWIVRLFSVIMAMALGIILNPVGIDSMFGLFFGICWAYALFLLFKKYVYPWTLGEYRNLIIEAIEIMVLLYVYSASRSPLTAVLFISFIIRMRMIYANRIFLLASVSASLLFLFISFYNQEAELNTHALNSTIYFTIGYAFLIWTMWELYSMVEDLKRNIGKLNDVLAIKDVLINELKVSRDNFFETNNQAHLWANKDSLTNLYNFRYFNRYWDNIYGQFKEVKKNKHPISLVMINIQGHNMYNNIYGYAAGDTLLKDIALVLEKCTGDRDIAVRYSDHVFAIIIPGQQESGAVEFYNRFKTKVNEYSKKRPGMENIGISLGWSFCNDIAQETKDELIAQATSNMQIIN